MAWGCDGSVLLQQNRVSRFVVKSQTEGNVIFTYCHVKDMKHRKISEKNSTHLH